MNKNSPIIQALLELNKATCFLSYHDPAHPLFKRFLQTCGGDIDTLLNHLRTDEDPDDAHKFPRGSWWVVLALARITGINPIKKKHAGYLREIINDWLAWDDKRKKAQR